MLERFIKLYSCIVEYLADIQHHEKLENVELQVLIHLVTALKPIQIVVVNLSKNTSNIYTADIILETLLQELKGQTTVIGQELNRSVEKKIGAEMIS